MAGQEQLSMEFDIVTPEGKFFSGLISQVDIPGKNGYFGVLPNHIPLISTLSSGVLTINPDNSDSRKFYVSGGFAEVTPKRCAILASYVVDLASLTKEDVQKQLEALDFSISTTVDTDKLALLKSQKENLSGLIACLV